MIHNLQFIQVKTPVLKPPQDDLYSVIEQKIDEIKEGDIVLIASKVVSIHQGRCVKKNEVNKDLLVEEEADAYLPREQSQQFVSFLTMKNNALALSAGIDPMDDYYVLLPDRPHETAEEFRQNLKKKYRINNLGVIVTDSHSAPLRRGVTCYAVGFAGIQPLTDDGPKRDFAKWTVNVIDVLASIGGVYLGEASHQRTPIVIIRGADFVNFTDKPDYTTFFTQPENDLYYPVLKHFIKKKP